LSSTKNAKLAQLRAQLARSSLEWERRFAVLPSITGAVAEFDAARLKGTSLEIGRGRTASATAVKKGWDFEKEGVRYQVKGNRPSGKPGSRVTLVSKAKNYDWDMLIWILYDRSYNIQEAREWSRESYRRRLGGKRRLSPTDMRLGRRIR
jgi:hypothetical protein